MKAIASIDELESHYGTPSEAATMKVVNRLTPNYRRFIEASPFVLLATSGPEGLDCSPRGDAGQAVRVADDRTLMMADRRGNNRVDSLRNIVRDARVGLLFLVPGSQMTMRVNGEAIVTADEALRQDMAMDGHVPRTVVVVTIAEVYFQCSRAVLRAGLWDEAAKVPESDLPTAGQFLKEIRDSFDGATFDREWPERAKASLW